MSTTLDVVRQTTQEFHMKTMKQTTAAKTMRVIIYTLETIHEREYLYNPETKYYSTKQWVNAGCYSKKEYVATTQELRDIARKWYPRDTEFKFAQTLNEVIAGSSSNFPRYVWTVPDGVVLKLRERKPKNAHSRKRKKHYYCDCRLCERRARAKGSAGAPTLKLRALQDADVLE